MLPSYAGLNVLSDALTPRKGYSSPNLRVPREPITVKLDESAFPRVGKRDVARLRLRCRDHAQSNSLPSTSLRSATGPVLR